MKRVRVVVSGRVQGVFYRATCAEHARRLGVAGWVRNLPDGRVEAAFEGPDAAVDAMVSWCGEGPPYARVEGVEVHAEDPRGEAGFRVR
ncbi:MAG TPA: acylphosphatase [Actinomycetota bacterium]|nr:acylphosphatase [Actinomycetota bacterium]